MKSLDETVNFGYGRRSVSIPLGAVLALLALVAFLVIVGMV